MAHLKVLVVEDDLTVLDLLEEGLQSFGFEIRIAEDYEKAKVVLEREPIDVVLTDGNYPGGGAKALLKYMKATSQLHKVPVVILTAGLDTDDPIFRGVPVLPKPSALRHIAQSITMIGTAYQPQPL